MTETASGLPGYETIDVELTPTHVAVVTVDRPPVNAMNRRLREELTDAFDRLQDVEQARVVVLTAAGTVFCAGADIKEKARLTRTDGDRARADRLTRETFLAILGSAKPVIAAVNGGALGAGCVLAACCDFIVAAQDSYFAMPEIDVGQGGGASYLRRILPAPRVRRMVLTGERVPAVEMYRLGGVEEIVPAASLRETVMGFANTIAAKSPLATRAIRGAFGEVDALPLREGIAVEQRYTAHLSSSPDADEARRAFLEKRAPRF